MTLFYYSKTGRTITSDETKERYGTEEAMPALGIHPLTYQPDFTPFAFNPLANGSFHPVEGNIQEQVAILVNNGYTEQEATALFSD